MWHKGIRIDTSKDPEVLVSIDRARLRKNRDSSGQRQRLTWVYNLEKKLSAEKRGIGGIDDGKRMPSSWYYVWLLRSSKSKRTAAVLSRLYDSPALESKNWDQFEILSVIWNDRFNRFGKGVIKGNGKSTVEIYRAKSR